MLRLDAARLRYTLRQRSLPSFIGAVGAMFSSQGGYFLPLHVPACCKAQDWTD